MVFFEVFPFVTHFLKEDLKNFVKITKYDSFFVFILFSHECIGCDWFWRHLNMTHFVFMYNAVSSMFLQARESLSNEKLERIFYLISDYETNWWDFIISLDDDYLFSFRILNCNHWCKYRHFESKLLTLSFLIFLY